MKRPPLSVFFYFALLVCLLLPASVMAQGDPGCDPFDPLCPIDGGLSLLIAAGIGLGAKKAWQQSRKAPTAKR